MAWKINTIKITNFKGFYGEHMFDLQKGKNVLAYGENGSGKSSLYWSLYTHFQSCLKTQDATGAGKYFDPNNNQNLRNRFCDQGDLSEIEVEFIDTATKHIKRYSISNRLLNTAVPGDTFMFQTLWHSDFLNYKFLYSLFDFKNSQVADVFDIFLNSIFPCSDFSESLIDLDGVDRKTTNMKDWWNYIIFEAPGTLRKGKKFSNNYVRGDARYQEYRRLIKHFNDLLKSYVQQIVYQTNELLKSDFELPAQINLEYIPLDFDRPKRPGTKIHDGMLYKPAINMTAKMVNVNLIGDTAMVSHPQSFFNEAKLAKMALAIRLSVINAKGGAVGPGAHVLCLDDMMISLDMSNRMDVVDYMLKNYKDYQLIILTHDRALYRLVQTKITSRQNEWIQKELYSTEECISPTQIPNVLVIDKKSNLDMALKELKEFNYPGCANNLRKECERLLHQLLPRHMQYDANVVELDLSKKMDKVADFCRLYDLPNIMPNLDIYREHILNPLSHDDFTSNVFRRELVQCMEELKGIEPYVPKTQIVNDSELPVEYTLDMHNSTASYQIKFEVKDVWDYIVFEGVRHYRHLNVEIKASSSAEYSIGQSVDLHTLWTNIGKKLRIAETDMPMLESVVYRVSDGKYLKDL